MQDILDLDSSMTWNSDFKTLVYASETWAQIVDKARGTGGDEFLAALTYAEDRLKENLTRSLRAEAVEILRDRHDSVMAYHGCRPRDPRSYQMNGVMPSDPSRLIENARSLFAGFPNLEHAIMQMASSDYLCHVHGRVWLYFSGPWARHCGDTHIQGSELIRGIAERLGREASLRYEMTGKATHIQCKISIVIEGLVRTRLWPEEGPVGFPGAYYVTETIAPESIIDFIDVSGDGKG